MESRTQTKVSSWPVPFQSLYKDLLRHLNEIQNSGQEPILDVAKKCIVSVKLSMAKLREEVVRNQFSQIADEIFFFKQIKPVFHRHLIFWAYVSNIELLRPIGSKQEVQRYLQPLLSG